MQRLSLWAAALICLLLSLTATAQQTSAAPDSEDAVDFVRVTPEASESRPAVQLEQVVVRGEKVGRTAMDTVSSVAVTTRAEIEAFSDQTIDDVLARTANVVATDNGQFSIRGINSSGPDTNEFAEPVASIYVDGVALDRIGQQFGGADLYDIEQIEILRGPQSTTQGRNALAGAVVIETRAPTLIWDAEARARLNREGDHQLAFAGGGPLGPVPFRLIYDDRAQDGFVTNITRDEADWARQDSQQGRLRLGWQPRALPALGTVFTVTRTERSEGPDRNFEADGARPRTAEANERSVDRIDLRTAALDIHYDLAPRWSLRATSAFLDSTQDSRRDRDFSAADAGLLTVRGSGDTLTQETRLNMDGWRGLRGVIGVYAGRFDEVFDARNTDVPVALDSLLPAVSGLPLFVQADIETRVDERVENMAIFANVDYAWNARLTLTAGLRFDRESRRTQAPFETTRADLVGCTPEALDALSALLPGIDRCAPGIDVRPVLAQTPFVPGAGDDVAEATYNALLPRLGVRYAFTPDLAAFLTYTEGYRAGGAEVLFTTGDINTFDPEFTRNYETGLRAAWLDGALRTDLTLYYIDWQDQQVQRITEDGSDSFTDNAAQSRVYGAEADVAWRLTRRLRLGAALGLTDTRFEDFRDGRNDFSGNEFPRAPHYSGSLSARWNTTPGSLGWFAASSINVSDGYFLQPENDAPSRSDRYAVLNLRVGYALRNATLSLVASNLTDRRFATFRQRLEAENQLGREDDGFLVTYGAPRVIGLQLDIRL
ncbi:TonB-dependent receptor [Algiphilus sp.]|uniref:TonB-dependent receptor n=1 Tax=Algiphilus sp. TaxID=1872431 RepID=UPI003B51A853